MCRRDDGRQYRARDQLLGGIPEISFAGARRLRRPPHWLLFLLFSVASGALAERFDPRRVIQAGMGLFIVASPAWGYFFVTDTLQMWQAMMILVIHGYAGVLWQTPNQMLLYDMVGHKDLESAVRLNAMARYLGVLVGSAVGGAILLALGPRAASCSRRCSTCRWCCG